MDCPAAAAATTKRDFLTVLVGHAVGELGDDKVQRGGNPRAVPQGDHGRVPGAGGVGDGLVGGGDEGSCTGQVGRVLDGRAGGGGGGLLLLLLVGRHDDEVGGSAAAEGSKRLCGEGVSLEDVDWEVVVVVVLPGLLVPGRRRLEEWAGGTDKQVHDGDAGAAARGVGVQVAVLGAGDVLVLDGGPLVGRDSVEGEAPVLNECVTTTTARQGSRVHVGARVLHHVAKGRKGLARERVGWDGQRQPVQRQWGGGHLY